MVFKMGKINPSLVIRISCLLVFFVTVVQSQAGDCDPVCTWPNAYCCVDNNCCDSDTFLSGGNGDGDGDGGGDDADLAVGFWALGKTITYIIIGVVVGVVVLIILCIVCCCCCCAGAASAAGGGGAATTTTVTHAQVAPAAAPV